MKLGENSWLADHQQHCLTLDLDVDLVKKRIITASIEVERLLASVAEEPGELNDFILEDIVSKLEARLVKGNTIGLLCSGGEDSIYLLMALVRGLGKSPKLFCYETKNNSSDVKRLKKIANILNLELYLFDSDNLDRSAAYKIFIESQKRPPNDLAQPVHNALYFEAVENHDCDVVIDGQFCDTVLLSNPQNHFLLWMEKHPVLIRLAIKFLNYLPLNKSSKFSSRLSYLQDLSDTSTSIERIFKLINLKNPDEDVITLTGGLVDKFGTQLTFSICFFYCLLAVRERDKYLLCPDLFSPFDDFSFAIICSRNIEQVLGSFVRKKPIRNVCKKYFPSLFRLQNTLPFELE